MKGILQKAAATLQKKFFPTKWKELNEMLYWRNRKNQEGKLGNSHYEYFYTTHFGVDKSSYDGKILMDIGCGPRGSLEWANNAKRRIGVDPLANKYKKELGADKHKMEYIASGSEHIPLKDGTCDIIFSFNSFDHVKSVTDTVKEIKRCLSPKGTFYLLVEVNHPPTPCEPHSLSPAGIIDSFTPELKAEDVQVYKPKVKGIYQSIKIGEKFDDPINCQEIGYFSARFVRSHKN